MSRLLLADDDVELTAMLKEYLEREGFSVDLARDGESAIAKVRRTAYDLLVLDVMMPGPNGFDVLREIRSDSLLPVLMLTARGDDVDSIVGLELGADDYLPKPCNPRVLVARIRAVLRRTEPHPEPDGGIPQPQILQVGDLELHPGARRILCRSVPVPLTSTEYSVLEVLVREAGHVVPKAVLCERALGRKLARYDRSLDMHISSLRRKLGPMDGGDERIKTVRGVGYQYTRN